MPKKKVTLSGPFGSMDFEVNVSTRKPKKVIYKKKELNIDTFVATGMGLSSRISFLSKCRCGKEIILCPRHSRKEGDHFSR
jgi:hypothetical protein